MSYIKEVKCEHHLEFTAPKIDDMLAPIRDKINLEIREFEAEKEENKKSPTHKDPNRAKMSR